MIDTDGKARRSLPGMTAARTWRMALLAALLTATAAPQGWAQGAAVRIEAMNSPDLTFEILDLRRIDGGMVRLSAKVVNNSPNSDTISVALADIKLIDPQNRLQYNPVRMPGTVLSSAGNYLRVSGQSQQAFWMNFPAPADRVERVTVHIPDYMPADNVPITR